MSVTSPTLLLSFIAAFLLRLTYYFSIFAMNAVGFCVMRLLFIYLLEFGPSGGPGSLGDQSQVTKEKRTFGNTLQ